MPPPAAFWHTDPDDGEVFSQRDAYCFDVSFRHGVNTREIKRIWELKPPPVPGSACCLCSALWSPADLNLVGRPCAVVDGGQPSFSRAELGSGIELALRLISVALCLSMIGVERLDEETRQAALQFFFAHVYWLKRFPSLHSSANNHRIAELAGLIVGTTMAPGIPGADDCAKSSWRDLLIEIDRQIYPDGVGAEQAPNYTAFAIELFLVAAVFSRKTRLACGHRKSACGLGRALLMAHGHRLEGTAESAIGTMPRYRNEPSPRAEICSFDRLGGCWLRWPT